MAWIFAILKILSPLVIYAGFVVALDRRSSPVRNSPNDSVRQGELTAKGRNRRANRVA